MYMHLHMLPWRVYVFIPQAYAHSHSFFDCFRREQEDEIVNRLLTLADFVSGNQAGHSTRRRCKDTSHLGGDLENLIGDEREEPGDGTQSTLQPLAQVASDPAQPLASEALKASADQPTAGSGEVDDTSGCGDAMVNDVLSAMGLPSGARLPSDNAWAGFSTGAVDDVPGTAFSSQHDLFRDTADLGLTKSLDDLDKVDPMQTPRAMSVTLADMHNDNNALEDVALARDLANATAEEDKAIARCLANAIVGGRARPNGVAHQHQQQHGLVQSRKWPGFQPANTYSQGVSYADLVMHRGQ